MLLTSLLHDDGENIVVSVSYHNPDGSRGGWLDKPFNNLRDAESYAQKSGATANVHIKHALHDGAVHDGYKATTSLDHFIGSRTFFVDVDTGPNKPYPDLLSATRAIASALASVAAIHLPQPNLITRTGGGIHVCWVIDRVVPAEEWKRYTRLLLLLMRNGKLDYDGAASTLNEGIRACGDGYFNFKKGVPTPTNIMRINPRIPADDFISVLDANAIRPVGVDQTPVDTSAFDAFRVKKQYRYDLPAILPHCEMLKHSIATGGVDDDEPVWFEKLWLLTLATDRDYARKVAHYISEEHPKYDKGEETDAKFDYIIDRNYQKPPTCDNFAGFKGSVCHTCKFVPRPSTPPAILGRLAPNPSDAPVTSVAVPILPGGANPPAVGAAVAFGSPNDGLPSNMYYNSEGGLRRIRLGDDAPDASIWSGVAIFTVALTKEDGGTIEYLEFAYQSPRGVQIALPLPNLADGRAMALYLARRYNIVVSEWQRKGIHAAMTSWIESLRKRQLTQNTPSKHYTHMGWSKELDAFSLGRRVYFKDGTAKDTPVEHERMKFQPHGDATTQKTILDAMFLGEVRPEAHAMLSSSLAAPLLKLIGCPGMSINFYSTRSGYGKTTIAKMCASAWGHHEALMIGVDDTHNAVIKRISQLCNLPAYFDELRVADTQQYVRTIIFRMAQGTEKHRMTADNGMHEAGSWQTLMTFSTNFAFAGLLGGKMGQGDAASARFMDFQLGPLPSGSGGTAIDVGMEMSKLEQHYGHIGHAFAKYLVENRVSVIEELRKASKQLMKFSQVSSDDASGRNHVMACACLFVASMLAEQHDFLPVQSHYVMTAVINALRIGKQNRKDAQETINPHNVIREFILRNDHRRLVTTGEANKLRKILSFPRNNNGTIAFEIDRQALDVVIDHHAFCEWLRTEGYNVVDVLAVLVAHNTGEKRSFGRETELVTPPRKVLVIHTAGTEYEGLMGGS